MRRVVLTGGAAIVVVLARGAAVVMVLARGAATVVVLARGAAVVLARGAVVPPVAVTVPGVIYGAITVLQIL